jgi:membrane-associated phospholipid phosphatase
MSLHPIAKSTQWLTAVVLIGFSVYLLQIDHGDFVLWLNAHHSPFADDFFKYWTYVGDGVMLGVVALIFLLTNYYRFYTMLIAIAFQTAFVHLFKQWLAAGKPRPKQYFEATVDQLNFVEGVVVRSFDSFPSGHTASAFTLFFFLMLVTKNIWLQLSCLVAAVLVGISRVYILQHFAIDIYFGALFGILSVLIATQIMKKQAGNVKLQRGLLKKS